MAVAPYRFWQAGFGLNAAALLLLSGTIRLPLAALLAGQIALFIRGIVDIRSQFFCPVLFRGDPAGNAIALTFDDGPDPQLTPDILDQLRQHGFRATFFVVAEKVRRNEALCRRAFEEGHTIACHDLSHSNLSNFRLGRRIAADLHQAQEIITAAIGVRPRLYRPPVGLMNPHVPGALKKVEMSCIGWSASARDGGNRIPGHIARIHSLAAAGHVVLLHDGLPRPEFKPMVLSQLGQLFTSIRELRLKTVSVDQLFGIVPYKE
jgi:peptidoglycan/xylan/chitin deacetylase (PgdA/CDA1 family)